MQDKAKQNQTTTPGDRADATDRTDARPRTIRRRLIVWAQRGLLILFGLLLAHVALEAMLRIWGFAHYYEVTHHRSDHPESAYVILAVGDSVTYGYCSSDPKTKSYPAHLQRLLDNRAPEQDIRVEKMGFPGANSSQIARRLDGFLNLHNPDLLILLIGNNDVWNLKETRADLFAEDAGWWDRMSFRFAAWRDEVHVLRFYKWMGLVLFDEDKEFKAMKGVAPDRKHFDKGAKLLGEIGNVQRLYEHNFGEMLALAEERGIEVMVLDYHNPAWMKETEYLKPALANLGVEMVDLEPHFNEAKRKGLNAISAKSIGWHPNDRGYAICARVVFNELVRRGIVKAEPLTVVKTKKAKE